jgi:hypothetical protein
LLALAMAKPLTFILWLLILVFVGWWVGFFCAGLFVFISPCTVCVSGCSGITDFLKKGMDIPVTCARVSVASAAIATPRRLRARRLAASPRVPVPDTAANCLGEFASATQRPHARRVASRRLRRT